MNLQGTLASNRTPESTPLRHLYWTDNFEMCPQCFEKDDLHDQIYHPNQIQYFGEAFRLIITDQEGDNQEMTGKQTTTKETTVNKHSLIILFSIMKHKSG